MNWIHFTDFHFGKPNGPQQVAMQSLLKIVEFECSKIGNIGAIFITGDIAFSGKLQEFTEFKDQFLLPLKKMSFSKSAKIIAVPGNHDIDCEIGLPIKWDSIGKRNQEVFFYEDVNGRKARKARAEVFEAYWKFVEANQIISPNPSNEVTLLYEDPDLPFRIAACNTAFFSDREFSSEDNSTPSPLASLRQILGKLDQKKATIILAHHPVTCFFKHEQKAFETFLKDNNAVLLHGHLHEPMASFNSDATLRSLGFGANYVSALEQSLTLPYKNSFTLCSLEDYLSVKCFSWDPYSGKWVDSTTTDMAAYYPAGIVNSGHPKLSFPYPQPITRNNAGIALSTVPRAAPVPKQVIPVRTLGTNVFKRIIAVSHNLTKLFQKDDFKIRDTIQTDGKIKFELDLPDGTRHLAFFIPGVNHVLSSKEVESLNTTLDTEGFNSTTIISLGKISNDAQTMYLRLKARKEIEILVNTDIAANANYLLSADQKRVLTVLDTAIDTVTLLLSENDVYLLVITQTNTVNSFYIVNQDGVCLDSTEPIVAEIRQGTPELSKFNYKGENTFVKFNADPIFDKAIYLTNCYNEYNVVKYAALASVGIRFSDLPLEDLYVSASASEIIENSSCRFEQMVDDHLESYPLSPELKKHIQQQLLNEINGTEQQEVSLASEYYQKFGAILVVGDPGSGKTCFVKNEILAYAKYKDGNPDVVSGNLSDWYSFHTPIMVQLSEIVADKNLSTDGILPAIAVLLERKGFSFPTDTLVKLLKEGKLAFFFDGLDEVVSIEKRALIVQHINNLITEAFPLGNRFVVTSRPAAIQLVNLLPTLHKLELQGLSHTQIRALASRLLSLKLSDTSDGIVIDQKDNIRSDNTVIAQLMEDCERNPGVARLAQNPLLLTLLIMVYANSGALSAKRHKIYEDAIKTLAAVRSREAGLQPISTQDLRERLGAIALAVYKKESGLLPSRNEVCEIVRCVMQRQRNEYVSSIEANEFIQKVAESTGLISIETRTGASDNDAIITFMHHSFLEYFAAIGLSRSLAETDLGTLVEEPRWSEILTLLAGIIGESEDVAPILEKFLLPTPNYYDVDAKKLIFAMDCALECEVPSEAAQRLLSKYMVNCLKEGPARLDPWIRAEIGQRLGYLQNVCGSNEFDTPISELILKSESDVCAAAIDLIGYTCSNGCISSKISEAFTWACSQTDERILSSICIAASRSPDLQNQFSLQVIAKCLKKSRQNRNAAFEAIIKIPGLAAQHWSDIINGIDDTNEHTRRLASKAAIHAGLNTNIIALAANRKDLLLRSLSSVNEKFGRLENLHNRVKKEVLEPLLGSASKIDRNLGIYLLTLADCEPQFIFDRLLQIISESPDREEVNAALKAISWSTHIHALVTKPNLKTIDYWLKNGTMDVRISASELLGEFPYEIMAIESLLKRNYKIMDTEEFCKAIESISGAKILNNEVSELIFNELYERLNPSKKMTEDNVKRISALLDGARRIGAKAPKKLSVAIRDMITDFRKNKQLQQKALLCFPAISLPSRSAVMEITELCLKMPFGMEVEISQIPSIVASKCRESVDSVVACISALPALKDSLLKCHANLMARPVSDTLEFCVTEIRNGITEINQIIVAFNEFIEDDAKIDNKIMVMK